MSTTYTDYKDTSPVAVSPDRRRSSCSCVAAGCGCIIVVFIILGVIMIVMGPTIQKNLMTLGTQFFEQVATPFAKQAADDAADDPRVIERLGEPINITRDESIPFSVEDPQWTFTLEGAKESATVVVELVPAENGRFEPGSLIVTFADGTTLDILEEPIEPVGPVIEVAPMPQDDVEGARIQLDGPYAEVVRSAARDTRIQQALGQPLRAEFIRGDIQPSRSEWEFALHGPNGSATGSAITERDGDNWRILQLEVTLEDGTSVDVLEE